MISLLVLLAYEELVVRRFFPPPSGQQTSARASRASATPTAAPSVSTPIAVTTPRLAFAPLAGSAQTGESAERTVEIDAPIFRCRLTTIGARLSSFQLLDYRATAAPASPPLDLIRRSQNGTYPFGLAFRQGDKVEDDSRVAYQTQAPARIVLKRGSTAEISFSASTPDGLKLSKVFSFSADSYAFWLNVKVEGVAGKADALGLELSQEMGALEGYRNSPTVEAEVNGKTLVEAENTLASGVAPVTGAITYAGFGDRYFLSVVMPKRPSQGTLEMGLNGGQALALLWFPLDSQAAIQAQFLAYLGPKKLDILEAVDPHLRDSINFGWAAMIAVPFVHALNFFHRFAPNYGVDIILLTIAIRLLLLPVSLRSQRSMMKMQRLAPQIERLREKYKDDHERLNREMMDLYRRNHVNPLGGCLPTLLQLPIFIGLYEALLNAVELRHAPFILWIRDLSAPECLSIPHMPKLPFTDCAGIPVLVLLMGLSAFIQQKMSPQPVDPSQQRMMMWMPLVFTLLFLNFPSGLTLYYLFTNLLGMLQQYVINREFKQLAPVAQ